MIVKDNGLFNLYIRPAARPEASPYLPVKTLKFGTPSVLRLPEIFGQAHAARSLGDFSEVMQGRRPKASGEKLPAAESISS